MKHFAQITRCSKEHPVLLIIDNHGSHTTLEAVEFARENGIVILTLYPHTSHKMQPLDVPVYGPFKRAYANAMNDWMTNNVGKRFTIHEVAECSANAINIAFTQSNIISGFKSTGVCPFNANVFGPSDFLGSEPTDAPLDRATSDYSITATTTASQTSEETNPSEPVPIEPVLSSAESSGLHNEPNMQAELEEAAFLRISGQSQNSSRNLESFMLVPPRDVHPLPKADFSRKSMARRNKGDTVVLTSTPAKKKLEAKRKLSKSKKVKVPRKICTKQRKKEMLEKAKT